MSDQLTPNQSNSVKILAKDTQYFFHTNSKKTRRLNVVKDANFNTSRFVFDLCQAIQVGYGIVCVIHLSTDKTHSIKIQQMTNEAIQNGVLIDDRRGDSVGKRIADAEAKGEPVVIIMGNEYGHKDAERFIGSMTALGFKPPAMVMQITDKPRQEYPESFSMESGLFFDTPFSPKEEMKETVPQEIKEPEKKSDGSGLTTFLLSTAFIGGAVLNAMNKKTPEARVVVEQEDSVQEILENVAKEASL
jgi:hypothetical protein